MLLFLRAELSVKVFSQFDAFPYDTKCAKRLLYALGTPQKGSENEQPEGQVLV